MKIVQEFIIYHLSSCLWPLCFTLRSNSDEGLTGEYGSSSETHLRPQSGANCLARKGGVLFNRSGEAIVIGGLPELK